MRKAFEVNVGSWAVSQAQNVQNLKDQAQVPMNIIITPDCVTRMAGAKRPSDTITDWNFCRITS